MATVTPLMVDHDEQLFDASQLPSVLKDGMTVAQEAEQRRKTCRFLEQAVRQLKKPRIMLATAMVIFHRFYAKHAFSEHDRFEVAMACIVLASKVEESPLKVKPVMELCHQLKVGGLQKAGANVSATMKPTLGEEEFNKLKERVLLLERILLHTIGFELSIDHPYKFFADHIRVLVQQGKLAFLPGPLSFLPDKPTSESLSPSQTRDALMKCMMQGAMNFANDSLHTTLCLQFDPKDIAFTCIYLAGQFHRVKTAKDDDWTVLMAKSMDLMVLVPIALQILEPLAARNREDQTAAIATVRKQLQAMQSPTTTASAAKRPRVS